MRIFKCKKQWRLSKTWWSCKSRVNLSQCLQGLILSSSLRFLSLAAKKMVSYSGALLYGQIAQLVEQRTENPCVAGSIPVLANLSLAGEKRKSNGVGNST